MGTLISIPYTNVPSEGAILGYEYGTTPSYTIASNDRPVYAGIIQVSNSYHFAFKSLYNDVNIKYGTLSSFSSWLDLPSVSDSWYYRSESGFYVNLLTLPPGVEPFSSDSDFLSASQGYPITYRLTNCTAPSAPSEAAVGDTVTVPLVLQEGYDIITPSTDIVVTNNGVAVPHTYTNGTISFTMPDPS